MAERVIMSVENVSVHLAFLVTPVKMDVHLVSSLPRILHCKEQYEKFFRKVSSTYMEKQRDEMENFVLRFLRHDLFDEMSSAMFQRPLQSSVWLL